MQNGSLEHHSFHSLTDVKVELVGGPSRTEGRVEIVRNGVRGTVCDDEWDDDDAKVVCAMLGYR